MRKLAFLVLLLGLVMILVGCGSDTQEVKIHLYEFHSDAFLSKENLQMRIYRAEDTDPLSREQEIARRLEMSVNSGAHNIVAVETAYNSSGLLCRATVYYCNDDALCPEVSKTKGRLKLALIPGGMNEYMPWEREERVLQLRNSSLRRYGKQLSAVQEIYDSGDQLMSVEIYYLADET